MAQAKYKLGFGEQNLFKETPMKRARPTIASKRPVIIGTLSALVICHAATIPQKEFPDSLMSKYKIKVMPIIHITKAINTPKHNVRQAQQIEDSPSSSKDKIRCQSLESIISDLLMELNYLSIDEFWNVFGDEASMERLSICKNGDENKNMMRSFYIRLALFV